MEKVKTREVLAKDLEIGNRFRMLGDLDFHVVHENIKVGSGGGLHYFVGEDKRVIWYNDYHKVLVEVGCCGRCLGGSDECGEDNYVPVVVGLAAEKEDKLSIPCSWSATNELRWNKIKCPCGSLECEAYANVLQQKWQGSDGSVKWEDVPVVDAAENGNDNLEN